MNFPSVGLIVFVDLSLKYFVFSYPESPERVTAIMEELERQDLLPLCIRVEVRLNKSSSEMNINKSYSYILVEFYR